MCGGGQIADATSFGSSKIDKDLSKACQLGGEGQELQGWELESLRWRRQDDGFGEHDYPN